MRSSKGLSGKENIWQNRIFAVIACLLIMVSGINIILLTGSNTENVQAEPEGRMSRSSRAPNTQNEPANDNINTADTVTYDLLGRIIDADIGTGDPWDYWKIPIDYGTKRYDGNSDLIGVNNSTKLIIILDNQGVGNGLLMTLYDAEKHELGMSVLAMQGGAQGEFTISGQVNSEVYIKIAPSGTGTGNYRLTIYNITQDYNPSWDDRNTFSTATKRNITLGFQKVEYLSYIYDNADFYSFDVIKNQKIVVEMTPVSTCDFDLYLFDSTDPSNPVAWSKVTARGPSGKERIVHISTSTNTYYLRVGVKIDGTWLGNNGNYTLTGSGNIPPYWNASFPDTYVVNEDSAPLTIEIEDAYFDVNPVDEIKYQIWNPIKGSGSWDEAPASFNLENATIEQNEDIFTFKTYIKMTPKTDKFGTETIIVRATDIEKDFYTVKNLTIKILPVNDLPILNGTTKWDNGNILTPSPDGKKLIGNEGELFNTKVTAWDPVDPWDVITFYDNTDIFDINPVTGEISFSPTYHVTGTHFVNITAKDNGTSPNETTDVFEFVIKRGSVFPIVNLNKPLDNSVQYTLKPEFVWEQTNEVYFDQDVNYEFYLSTIKDKVTNRDSTALVASLNNTFYKPTTDLDDTTTYYWTVIPNDGIHLGECESGVFSFSTNLYVEIPRVQLVSPFDNQMLDTKNVLLTWELEYNGPDPVKYDIFFEVSMEDMLDRDRTAYKDKVTSNSIEITGLYTDKYYYWQVIPWTPQVRLSSNESEIRTFYLSSQIPHIDLITPFNRTVQYDNWVTLTWEVDYTDPDDVICELYYGTLTPYSVQKMNFTGTYSHTIYNLEETVYFWNIVPYLGSNLRGKESEMRIFTINRNPNLLRTELLDPVNVTIYSQFITLSWRRELSENVDVASVWYEIFLDNSTSDPAKMQRISTDYRNIYYLLELPLEPRKTYYWYVIPHGDTPDTHIKGYCTSGVVSFIFDYASPMYDFNLEMEKTYLKIEPGTSKYFHFRLTNKGNRETSISLSISTTNAAGNINLTLATKRITLPLATTERINVTVLALPKAAGGNYSATVTAKSNEDLDKTKQDTITIDVTGGGKTNGKINGKDDGDESDNTLLIGVVAIIVIIIIILIVILLMRKRKTSATQPPDQAGEAQTGRVTTAAPGAVAPVQPVSPVRPVTPAQAPVRPVSPVRPVAPARVSAVKPVSPVQPVRPAPVKPVAPATVTPQPVKPVSTTQQPQR